MRVDRPTVEPTPRPWRRLCPDALVPSQERSLRSPPETLQSGPDRLGAPRCRPGFRRISFWIRFWAASRLIVFSEHFRIACPGIDVRGGSVDLGHLKSGRLVNGLAGSLQFRRARIGVDGWRCPAGRDHEHHREGGAAGCTGPPPPGRVFSHVASPRPPVRISDFKRTWV